jgi:hypothetical protein
MQLELFQNLNNYSLHTILSKPESEILCINHSKTERLATKDTEWPEIHTVTMAGYIHITEQFGFDGFDDINKVYCEVKSSSKIINKDLIQRFVAGEIKHRNELILSPIDGRGIFSLFTQEALQRHLDNEAHMLISAYINGVLMFIIEFPFDHPTFYKHIKRMLGTLGTDNKKQRAKTISFGYNQYKDCNEAKLVYLTRKENLAILKGTCSKNFYNYLTSLVK